MNSSLYITLILTGIILGLFALFLLGFLIFHKRKMNQNKDKIQKLELQKAKKTLVDAIEIQEAERSRIGADIHDDLGPTLSAMKLKINHLQSDEKISNRNIDQLKNMINETIKTVRGISHSLYPNTLEIYGLKNALTELASRINNDHIQVILTIDNEAKNLSFYQQINIYRIIQEFCNNSLKYSNCTKIKICIQSNENGYRVYINDNGDGFNISDHNLGLGLKNMKMRAEAINFDSEYLSKIGSGTSFIMISNNTKN